MSADGYIARADGDVEWLDRPKVPGDYGMGDFYKTIDTVILGRKTYDLALTWGQTSYPGKKNYVFTRSSPAPAKGIEFVNEDVSTFVNRLRKEKGKNVWLVGGAGLNAAFLDAGAVDELVIHVIPILIGDGIPLIPRRRREIQLDLISSKVYEDGVVRLHYAVGPRKRKQSKASKRPGSRTSSRQKGPS